MGIPKKIGKILIVRRDNIGDLVCTTPAIAALRKQYPNAEIAALVNSYNAPVLYDNPNLNRVFVYQKLKHANDLRGRVRALWERLFLIAKIRSWKPDVTILAKASYDRHGHNFARLIASKCIIGYISKVSSKDIRPPHVWLPMPEYTAVHEVAAINGLLMPFGIHDALGPLQVFPDLSIVDQMIKSLPAAPRRIALHISAREPERRWGVDNYIALTRQILARLPDYQILLFWAPGDQNDPRHPGDNAAAAHLVDKVQSDRVVPITTQNLSELIAAISLCDIFIGADGGSMHLAAGLKKSVVALFENLPQKLIHWHPWLVPNITVHGDRPEVASIKLEQVTAALMMLAKW